tara:strand:+ start:1224 stop:1430 length:207 start_codon:yes stop_codon:yes gene_type:complete
LGKLRIADEEAMFPPALMIKITEPSSELYEFKAISDEELVFANNNFIRDDLPYRVCRLPDCALNRVAA